MESASTIDELLSLMKSLETNGSSQKLRMPRMFPSAASLRAALTSSFVVDVLTSQTRSTNETVGVGTLTESPFSLPCNSGMTSPIAFAAPVDVGIMFKAAPRALLRSFR